MNDQSASAGGGRWKYPAARREEQLREHNLADPYRWLEDPDDDEVKAWVDEENKVFRSYVRTDLPEREKLKQRLTQLYNYPKFSAPFKRGSNYYFYKNDGLQNQSVLYSQPSLDAEAKVFLDPNLLEADGTASLGTNDFSEDGEYFAYGIKRQGSDWQTLYIRSVASGEVLKDKIEWVKFSSIAWTHDGRGFFYARYPKPDSVTQENAGAEVDVNLNHAVYYHCLGTQQSDDVLIFSTPDEPKLMFGVQVTDDGRYLIITIYKSTAPVNKLYYVELKDFDPTRQGNVFGREVVRLIDNWDAEYNYITNENEIFYFKTNLNAPRGKLITIDLNNPAQDHWTVLVPESEDVMSTVLCYDETRLVINYLHHVKDVLYIHNLADGQKVMELELPGPGTIADISGRRKDKELFYTYTSFLYPGTIYRFSYPDRPSVHHNLKVPGFDPSLFFTEQVFYNSKDGTRIPMFIVAKKSLKKDGSYPFYLYGYGGFSISIQPVFSAFRVVLMSHFDIGLAIPNIRGGGEYGEDWHQAGILDKKQNGFDDFAAAAEYLIDNKYTSAGKIAICGASNGGLLVGASINQRPELWGAAIAQVGVLDMLRFHKFTIGHAWTADYGCADNPKEFEYLIKYSPLHNVRPGKPYPAVLITTGDHDDRVVPLHSLKFAATLQHELGERPEQVQPLLIRVDVKAGHGAGKPTTKIIEETADIYTFIALALGLEWHD